MKHTQEKAIKELFEKIISTYRENSIASIDDWARCKKDHVEAEKQIECEIKNWQKELKKIIG